RFMFLGLGAGGLGLVACILAYQLRAVNRVLGGAAASHLLSKADLGIGRLVVFACLAVFAFALVTAGWRWMNLGLGWLLLPLGQNSLAAYILHVGVVMMIAMAGMNVFGRATSAGQNTILQLAGVV